MYKFGIHEISGNINQIALRYVEIIGNFSDPFHGFLPQRGTRKTNDEPSIQQETLFQLDGSLESERHIKGFNCLEKGIGIGWFGGVHAGIEFSGYQLNPTRDSYFRNLISMLSVNFFR